MAQTGAVVITNAPTLETIQNAQLNKSILQLQEAATQTANMKKSLDLLKETKDLLSNVNSKITASQQVYSTLKKQVQVLQNITDSKARIRKLSTIESDEFDNVFSMYGGYVLKANELLQTINSLLTSGIYNMNDFERLEVINSISNDLDKVLAVSNFTERRITEVNRRRTILNKM